MHSKTAVLNVLLLTGFTAGPQSRCQLEAIQTEGSSFVSRRIVVNMSANSSNHRANEAVEKTILDKGLGKKHSQYLIIMVALDAASSFILFHAARSLELPE